MLNVKAKLIENPGGNGGSGNGNNHPDGDIVNNTITSKENWGTDKNYWCNNKKKQDTCSIQDEEQPAEQCELDENVKERKIEIIYRI